MNRVGELIHRNTKTMSTTKKIAKQDSASTSAAENSAPVVKAAKSKPAASSDSDGKKVAKAPKPKKKASSDDSADDAPEAKTEAAKAAKEPKVKAAKEPKVKATKKLKEMSESEVSSSKKSKKTDGEEDAEDAEDADDEQGGLGVSRFRNIINRSTAGDGEGATRPRIAGSCPLYVAYLCGEVLRDVSSIAVNLARERLAAKVAEASARSKKGPSQPKIGIEDLLSAVKMSRFAPLLSCTGGAIAAVEEVCALQKEVKKANAQALKEAKANGLAEAEVQEEPKFEKVDRKYSLASVVLGVHKETVASLGDEVACQISVSYRQAAMMMCDSLVDHLMKVSVPKPKVTKKKTTDASEDNEEPKAKSKTVTAGHVDNAVKISMVMAGHEDHYTAFSAIAAEAITAYENNAEINRAVARAKKNLKKAANADA